MRNISMIIPVYQDKDALKKLLLHLKNADDKEYLEIIVVQADGSYGHVGNEGLKLKLMYADEPCRASQMNLGASEARGEILFFVHADALPPLSLVADIDHAIEKGHLMGGYRLKFDSNALLLNINAYISRFQNMYSGGGDQTLYIPKTIFINNGGYNPSYCIMEDFELVRRLEKEFGYYIIPKEVEVSARKYRYNSYFPVNYTNFQAFRMYKKGIASEVIKEYYYSSLNRIK